MEQTLTYSTGAAFLAGRSAACAPATATRPAADPRRRLLTSFILTSKVSRPLGGRAVVPRRLLRDSDHSSLFPSTFGPPPVPRLKRSQITTGASPSQSRPYAEPSRDQLKLRLQRVSLSSLGPGGA